MNRTRRITALIAGLAAASLAFTACGVLWDPKPQGSSAPAPERPSASQAPVVDGAPEGF